MESTSNPPLLLLFGLLFMMAGPIKAMPVFRSLTASLPSNVRTGLAIKSAAFGATAIGLAALMSQAMVSRYAVSGPAVGTAAGLLLTIAGLLPLIGHEPKGEPVVPPDALSLAFPALIPPHAFGVILLFCIYLPNSSMALAILGLGLMALNALAMIYAEVVLNHIGMTPLRLLGAVFGILQVALGIQMLFWGIPAGLGLRH